MRKKFTKNKYANTLSKNMIILFNYYSVDLYFSLARKIKLNEIMCANPSAWDLTLSTPLTILTTSLIPLKIKVGSQRVRWCSLVSGLTKRAVVSSS